MEIEVRLEVVSQRSDVVETQVFAANGRFCGGARVYLSPGAFEDVAAQLQGFPSHPDDTRLLLLGGFGPEFAGGGMSLAFSLADEEGRGRVQVVIEGEEEVAGVTEMVTLALGFELPALDAFLTELRRLEADKAGVARLKGRA